MEVVDRTRGRRRPPRLYQLAVVIAGLVGLWLAIAITANFTLVAQAPALVRAWWPASVNARLATAQALLAEEPTSASDKVKRAKASLRRAVTREPANSQLLGAVAALDEVGGDAGRARSLFLLSERASRRNDLTQLWLIEDAVQRNDVAGAVLRYDRLLRVSPDLGATLFPILREALSQPEVRSALLPVLAERPLWWKLFLLSLADAQETAIFPAVLRAVRLDTADEEQRAIAERLLRQMVARNNQRGALAGINIIEKRRGSVRPLVDGDFERAAGVLPFSWWLRDEANVRSFRDTVPNGTIGLRIQSNTGVSGGVAQQLVGLPAGTYLLRGRAGDVTGEATARPTITLSCASGKPIATVPLPSAPSEGRAFAQSFAVPLEADCVTQWVVISTAPAVDTDAWLDDLLIARTGAQRPR